MRLPSVYFADVMVDTYKESLRRRELHGINFLPRPCRANLPLIKIITSICFRLKWTWKVFTGQADVVRWADDFPIEELKVICKARKEGGME